MNKANENPDIYKITVTDIADSFVESWASDGNGKIGSNEWQRAFRVFGQSEREGEAAFVKVAGNIDQTLSRDDIHEALDVFFKSEDKSDPRNAMFGTL